MADRKTMRTSSSISNLPTELLIEILLRLPARSLFICKSVCKKFRTLILNPNFIDTHLNRIRGSESALLINCIWNIKSPYYQFLVSIDKNTNNVSSSYAPLLFRGAGELNIIGSCNGLLCADYHEAYHSNSSYLMLWNPVTRQNRYFQKPQVDLDSHDFCEFGFGPETNDYRVVRLVSGKEKLQIQVYKMSTDSWSNMDYEWTTLCKMCMGANSILPHHIPTFIDRGKTSVFLNGAFHWIYLGFDSSVVSFDLENEQFGVMKAFNDDRFSLGCHSGLVVIEGSLGLINWEVDEFEIYVMNDYGVQDSWVLRYRVAETMSRSTYPVGYWKNGLMIFQEGEGRNREERALLYNLNTGNWKKIPTLEACFILDFYSYVETLVQVNEVTAKANQ